MNEVYQRMPKLIIERELLVELLPLAGAAIGAARVAGGIGRVVGGALKGASKVAGKAVEAVPKTVGRVGRKMAIRKMAKKFDLSKGDSEEEMNEAYRRMTLIINEITMRRLQKLKKTQEKEHPYPGGVDQNRWAKIMAKQRDPERRKKIQSGVGKRSHFATKPNTGPTPPPIPSGAKPQMKTVDIYKDQQKPPPPPSLQQQQQRRQGAQPPPRPGARKPGRLSRMVGDWIRGTSIGRKSGEMDWRRQKNINQQRSLQQKGEDLVLKRDKLRRRLQQQQDPNI